MACRSEVDPQVLDGQLEGLHGDLVVLGVQARPGVLGRPRLPEVPAHHLGPVLVEQGDEALLAVDVALDAGQHPTPEADVTGDAALQGDVGQLAQPTDLADRGVVGAVAVFDRLHVDRQPADLREGAAHGLAGVDVGDAHLVVVGRVRVALGLLGPCGRWHDALLSCPERQATATSSRVFCLNRKMTNSAGRTGAMPIITMRRPLAMSSSVMVDLSQRTKNASACLVPSSAPVRQTVSRKLVTAWVTSAQRGSALGSNTTH